MPATAAWAPMKSGSGAFCALAAVLREGLVCRDAASHGAARVRNLRRGSFERSIV